MAKKKTHSKQKKTKNPSHTKKHAQKHSKSEEKDETSMSHRHSTKTNQSKNSKSIAFYQKPAFWIIIAIIAVLLIFALMINKPQANANTSSGVDVVEILEFTDFGCPYCARALPTLDQIKEEYGDSVKITFKHFPIEQLHPNSIKAHEASECARDQGKFQEYHDWLFANQGSHDVANLKATAANLGLNTETFNTCLDSGAKNSIVMADFSEGLAKGVSATPTFFVENEKIEGARSFATFKSAIDKNLATENSQTKSSTSEDALAITIVNDARCTECDISPLLPQLKEVFGNVEITQIDYTTNEGKAFYEKENLAELPAVLFTNDVKENAMYSELEKYFRVQGDYLLLAIGAEHNPTKEICTNNVDDTENGLIDCNDPDCTGALTCREEDLGNLQVFIMSDCPYGKEAIKALKEVATTFEGDINYEVHYIATETNTGFNSLHGQYEVDENIVQLCVKEHSPAVHMAYLYCRSVNGVKGIDWNTCAESAGVDIEAVEQCASGSEGASLLSKDIKIAQSLGVSASPTWLVNNKYLFNGIDAATVQQNICLYNNFEGCDAEVGTVANVPAGACS